MASPRNRNARLFSACAELACAFLLVCCLSGCLSLPSWLRIGSDPLKKEEKAGAKQVAAAGAADKGAQIAVHKADLALATAPNSKPVALARDYIRDAKQLLDQAHGAPTEADARAWSEIVSGLLSDVAQQDAAQKREDEYHRKLDEISGNLAKADTAKQVAEERGLAYAKSLMADANKLRSAKLILIGLFVLWAAGHFLGALAKLNPTSAVISGAATAVNAVLSPSMAVVANDAKNGLKAVGSAMADVRQLMPAAADQVTQIFDANLDSSHKAVVAASAAAAARPPTPAA